MRQERAPFSQQYDADQDEPFLWIRPGSDSHCIDLCKIELQGMVFLSAPFPFLTMSEIFQRVFSVLLTWCTDRRHS